MNRTDRLDVVSARLTRARQEGSFEDVEHLDHARFMLEELGRIDDLRDQLRDMRTRLELLQYELRASRDRRP